MTTPSTDRPTTAYRGVSFDSKSSKWQAYQKIDGKKHTFGNHATDHEAAVARNAGLVALLGVEEAAQYLNDVDADAYTAVVVTDAPAEVPEEELTQTQAWLRDQAKDVPAPNMASAAGSAAKAIADLGAAIGDAFTRPSTTEAPADFMQGDDHVQPYGDRVAVVGVMPGRQFIRIDGQDWPVSVSVVGGRPASYLASLPTLAGSPSGTGSSHGAAVKALANLLAAPSTLNADDMPFNVTEDQVQAAAEEQVRAAPFPDDLTAAQVTGLNEAGLFNLHDTMKRNDDQLFKLRVCSRKVVDLIRYAEAQAGLRPMPLFTEEAPATTVLAEVAPEDLIEPLTDAERADFAKLKTEAHDSAVTLWQALAAINDRRLYREQHATFEDFVQAEFGKGRQWAYQLIDAAKTANTLSAVGVQPANERQARDMKKAAKTVAGMAPDKQQLVAKVVEGLTGTDRPLAVQVNAVVEVVSALDEAATVDHPDTGLPVKLTELTPTQRVAALAENVTTSTYERLKRQEGHIEAKGKADKTLNGKGSAGSAASVVASSWADWLMNYAAQGLSHDHEVRLTIKKDPSGNPVAMAQVIDVASGQVIAEGEPNTRYVKGTVMSLIERLKYGGEVK